jgi:hypothetical protein
MDDAFPGKYDLFSYVRLTNYYEPREEREKWIKKIEEKYPNNKGRDWPIGQYNFTVGDGSAIPHALTALIASVRAIDFNGDLWSEDQDEYNTSVITPFKLLEEVDALENHFFPKKFDYYDEDFRKLRLQVFLRDGEVCATCGARPEPGLSLTIDHIKPVSKYPHLVKDISNLQVLCWDCNQTKSDKII